MSLEMFTRPKDWKYLVISSSDEAKPDVLRSANPFRVDKFLKQTCKGERIREVKSISLGRQLLVVVTNNEAAELLLKKTSIPGPTPIQIKVGTSDTLGSKQGIFFCRHIEDMTEEEIMQNLNEANKDLKICNVRKINKRGTDGRWIPSGSYVISMRCSEFPLEVRVGWTIQPLKRYIPDPMRCFRCNKLGHTGKRCREMNETQKNCINCNKPQHNEPGVRCEEPPSCANCNSTTHNSAFRGCQNYLIERRINELIATRDITRREATSLVMNESTPPVYKGRQPTLADRLVSALINPPPQTSQIQNSVQSSNTQTPQITTTNHQQSTHIKPISENAKNTQLPPSSAELSDVDMTLDERSSMSGVKQMLMAKRRRSPVNDEQEGEQKLSRGQIKRAKRKAKKNGTETASVSGEEGNE